MPGSASRSAAVAASRPRAGPSAPPLGARRGLLADLGTVIRPPSTTGRARFIALVRASVVACRRRRSRRRRAHLQRGGPRPVPRRRRPRRRRSLRGSRLGRAERPGRGGGGQATAGPGPSDAAPARPRRRRAGRPHRPRRPVAMGRPSARAAGGPGSGRAGRRRRHVPGRRAHLAPRWTGSPAPSPRQTRQYRRHGPSGPPGPGGRPAPVRPVVAGRPERWPQPTPVGVEIRLRPGRTGLSPPARARPATTLPGGGPARAAPDPVGHARSEEVLAPRGRVRCASGTGSCAGDAASDGGDVRLGRSSCGTRARRVATTVPTPAVNRSTATRAPSACRSPGPTGVPPGWVRARAPPAGLACTDGR